MITPEGQVKLIDFGLSKSATVKELMKSMTGTPYYMAPEVFESTNYTSAVDIWSLGVVLFTCLGGYRPFTGENLKEISKNILDCKFKFHHREWGSISRDAKDLMSMMLTKDTTKRITAEKALKHPWFGLITEIKLDSTIKKEQRVASKTMKKLKKFSQGNTLRRCAIEILIKMLSSEERADYEKEFNKFDTSKNGVITDKDFISKLQETEETLPHKEIKKIAKEIDYDSKALINYSDFITATIDVKKCLTYDRLNTIFNKFASDSKKIKAKNLQKVLDTYGYETTENE